MQGHILGEVTDLEFQNHKNVKKCTFRTLKQAGSIQWDAKLKF